NFNLGKSDDNFILQSNQDNDPKKKRPARKQNKKSEISEQFERAVTIQDSVKQEEAKEHSKQQDVKQQEVRDQSKQGTAPDASGFFDTFGSSFSHKKISPESKMQKTPFTSDSFKNTFVNPTSFFSANGNFKESISRDTNFKESISKDSNLKDSSLKGSNLKDSNLKGSNLKDSSLKGSNIKESNLKDSHKVTDTETGKVLTDSRKANEKPYDPFYSLQQIAFNTNDQPKSFSFSHENQKQNQSIVAKTVQPLQIDQQISQKPLPQFTHQMQQNQLPNQQTQPTNIDLNDFLTSLDNKITQTLQNINNLSKEREETFQNHTINILKDMTDKMNQIIEMFKNAYHDQRFKQSDTIAEMRQCFTNILLPRVESALTEIKLQNETCETKDSITTLLIRGDTYSAVQMAIKGSDIDLLQFLNCYEIDSLDRFNNTENLSLLDRVSAIYVQNYQSNEENDSSIFSNSEMMSSTNIKSLRSIKSFKSNATTLQSYGSQSEIIVSELSLLTRAMKKLLSIVDVNDFSDKQITLFKRIVKRLKEIDLKDVTLELLLQTQCHMFSKACIRKYGG
ncbi:hypothetical protein M153_33440001, partial [Pseudoloma neurophilia]